MPNISDDDLLQLRLLEESLWRSETRFSHEYMTETLAADFFEFGRSGRIYTRNDILNSPAKPIAADLPLRDFEARLITADVVLVSYVSGVTYDGVKELANRSSLWSRTPRGWQIRFHQGTPA